MDDAAFEVLIQKLEKLDDSTHDQNEKLKLLKKSVAKLASTQAGSRFL